MDKYVSRRIRQELRRLLLYEWDPIGISDIPEANDEYDSYVGNIFVLINNGATDVQVATHLQKIEVDMMGLNHRPIDDLLGISRKLIAAYLSIREEDGG